MGIPRTSPDLRATGRCARPGIDVDLFFATPTQTARIQQAKRLCRACPVARACGEWALAHPDLTQGGIWGGLTDTERTELATRRARRQPESARSSRGRTGRAA
jgi:WhiB family redox-sensing transcriptional regulator